jgi:hypothetical protein
VEAVTFLLAAVVLYWLVDRIVDWVEVSRGARFEQRTVVFFFILLGLALISFSDPAPAARPLNHRA